MDAYDNVAAAFRIFDRVGQHVGNDLFDPHLITVEHGGDIGIDVHLKLEIFLMRPDPDQIHQITEQRAELVLGWHNIHFAGFQF